MNTLKLLFISSLLFLSSYFFTQNNTETIISSGKWHVSSFQYGENIISIPNEELGKYWVIFGENDEYKDYTDEDETNTWTYNAKANTITIFVNGKASIKNVIYIDENELIFSTPTEGDNLITYLNR